MGLNFGENEFRVAGREVAVMAEDWRIQFNIDHGMASVSVAHGGETRKLSLGPAGDAVAAALAWAAEDDAQKAYLNLTTDTVTDWASKQDKA